MPCPEGPLVSIAILNWKRWPDTIRCLESLFRSDYPHFQVVVCDNGSQDDSLERIRAWADEHRRVEPDQGRDPTRAPLTLIQNVENLGFTGGCNITIAHALEHDADYVFLLNNDARVEPATLARLVAVAREADAAIVGARVLDESGTRVLFAGDRWPDCLFGLRFTPAARADRTAWSSSRADGAAMMIRRDLLIDRFAECGYYFDPSYFMYCEDLDLCLYAIARGTGCVVARDAVVYHGLAQSSGGALNPRSYYYQTRNRIYLANRWLSAPWKLLFHAYYLPSRALLQAMGKGRWRWRTLRAVARGLADGYVGVTGRWTDH